MSTNNGQYGAETEMTDLSALEYALNNKGSADVYKIKVRAYNARGWGDYSSPSENSVAWSAGTAYTVYDGTCGNRTSASRTDYTRTSLSQSYSTTGTYSADPYCVMTDTNCYNSATTSTVYSGSCGNRTSATQSSYAPKSGTACLTQTSTGSYSADPYCSTSDTNCYETPSTSTINCGTDCGTATRTTYTAKANTACNSSSSDGSCTAGNGWNNIAGTLATSGTFANINFAKVNSGDTTMYPASNAQCAPSGTYQADRVTADSGCCGGSELRYYYAYRCPTSANGSDRWVLSGCGQSNSGGGGK